MYVRWKGQARLAEAVRKLDESDPGWTMGELCAARNARLLPPERNSFTLIREAWAVLPKDFDKRKDPIENFRMQPANVCLGDDEYEALRKQVADCKAAIAVARRLTEGFTCQSTPTFQASTGPLRL